MKPGQTQLDYSPKNDTVLLSNPPSFVWIPAPGAAAYRLEYSTDPEFAPNQTTVVEGIDISVYTPDHTLDPSTPWYWRVRALDREGNASAPSHTRMFRIGQDAVHLPLPSPEALRSRIPTQHPRLYVTPDTLSTFRQKRTGEVLFRSVLWKDVQNKAIQALYAPLPNEPPHASPGGVWNVELWREYVVASRAADNMEALAFAYLLTEELEYAEAALRWMLHLAAWDPTGATSAAINDEASMPILLKMSRAYTWIYDTLSPEDRATILDVVTIRGNEVYDLLKSRPFESSPYLSHDARQLGFLIEPAIAFLGEIPEAKDWFDYVVRVIFAVYPAWGGESGGWSEGQAYWQSYINFAIGFVDTLYVATGLNLFEKSFFRNTGYFKLYTHPPYANMGPFGDFADRKPSAADGTNMRQFAIEYDNPYFEWYAEQVGGTLEMGVMGYIRAVLRPPFQFKGVSPLDLPSARVFPDIGWVVMHRRLGDAANAIQFMLRSSQYGSYSHAMADQNTFTLEAYGEPLAISSGYRPWYGSTHHMGWTKATQAHNGILVNGRGQPVQSFTARGDIVGFLHGRSFDYTVGDAKEAYPGLLNHFHRHVIYIRPDLFVIFDELVGVRSSDYSWLLHSYHQMEVDEATGSITVNAPKATLQGQLWSSVPFTFHQTNEFAIPLDEPMNVAEQWHLTARTTNPAREANFLAVLRPVKADDASRFVAEPMQVQSGQGVRIDVGGRVTDLLIRTGEGMIESEVLRSDGKVAAWSRAASSTEHGGADATDDHQNEGLLLVEGSEWSAAGGLRLQSSVSMSAELTIEKRSPGHVGRIEGSFVLPDGPADGPGNVAIYFAGAVDHWTIDTERVVSHVVEEGFLVLTLQPGVTQLVIRRVE